MDAWTSWSDAFVRALRTSDGDPVVVDLAAGAGVVLPSAPRRSWRRRPVTDGAPFLQALSTGPDDVQVELAGPERLGGGVTWAPEVETALTGLGWALPGAVRDHGAPTYLARFSRGVDVPTWAVVDRPLESAADLAVATLRGPCALAGPDAARITTLR